MIDIIGVIRTHTVCKTSGSISTDVIGYVAVNVAINMRSQKH